MGKYTFKPYSNIFPLLFRKERDRIAPFLPSGIFIEHVGSTAVRGLGGKGIIDIAIAAPKNLMEEIKSKLEELRYEFKPAYSTPDRFYFIIYLADLEEEKRRYHIHLTYPENKEWKDFLNFRDFLIDNPDALKEYAELKMRASLQSNQDGEIYRKMKEPIFLKLNSFKRGDISKQ